MPSKKKQQQEIQEVQALLPNPAIRTSREAAEQLLEVLEQQRNIRPPSPEWASHGAAFWNNDSDRWEPLPTGTSPAGTLIMTQWSDGSHWEYRLLLFEAVRDNELRPGRKIGNYKIAGSKSREDTIDYLHGYLNGIAEAIEVVIAGLESSETSSEATAVLTTIPENIAQFTFLELFLGGQALADGPSGRYWETVLGEESVIHIVPGATLAIKVGPNAVLGTSSRPASVEEIKAALKGTGVPGAIALNMMVALTIKDERVTLTLDTMMASIGWVPRSTAEREEKRRQLWEWLRLFEALVVIGKRPGTYKDRMTKKTLDLQSKDPLIRIVGTRFPMENGLLDNSQPPLDFSIVAGQWVERFRGDSRILTYLGDLKKIVAIPAKRTPGAWAQGIALALRQRWREAGARSEVADSSDDGNIVVRRPNPFTRRELFDVYQPEPSVYDLLASDEPGRAKEYWDEVIKYLKKQEIVESCEPLAPLPTRRQGWQEPWLDQPLDILPGKQAMADLAQISRAAKAVKGKEKKPREKGT